MVKDFTIDVLSYSCQDFHGPPFPFQLVLRSSYLGKITESKCRQDRPYAELPNQFLTGAVDSFLHKRGGGGGVLRSHLPIKWVIHLSFADISENMPMKNP